MKKLDPDFIENEMADTLPLVFEFADKKEIKKGNVDSFAPVVSSYHSTDKYAVFRFYKPISKVMDDFNNGQ